MKRTWWMNLLRPHYDALIVANGTPPPVAVFRALNEHCGKLIALDGGLNTLRQWKVVPSHVVGDLDSTTRPALTWSRKHGARVHLRPSQESADIDKGLQLCRKLGLKRVLLVAAEGDRLDHVINTLAAASVARGIEITLVTRRALVFVLRGKTSRECKIPEGHTISWFGLPEARGCTLEGVAWPFRRRRLKLGGFYSLSNFPAGSKVVARQEGGSSLLIISLRPKLSKTLLFKR